MNPNFRNADAFTKLACCSPIETRVRSKHRPFSLREFQRHRLPAEEFIGNSDDFFGSVSTDFRYAVEIRNAGLLGPRYHDMLRAHGVAHTLQSLVLYAPLAEQHQRMKTMTAPFTVLRLLTPLK